MKCEDTAFSRHNLLNLQNTFRRSATQYAISEILLSHSISRLKSEKSAIKKSLLCLPKRQKLTFFKKNSNGAALKEPEE